MIYPCPLKVGDTIGIVGPASSASFVDITNGITMLEALGFKTKLGKSAITKENHDVSIPFYLTTYDEIRAKDINDMFADDDIDAILCMRGGYGSLRILDLIDYELIQRTSKVFMGFSDITALLNAINYRTGIVTYHGPMLTSNFNEYNKYYFYKALTSNYMGVLLLPDGIEPQYIVCGDIDGQLVGGNLSVLASTMGTPYEIDTKGKVLFLEDVSEPAYKIDRYMTQLRLCGKLDQCNGLIFGSFTNCEGFYDVICDIVKPLNIPAVYMTVFGHGEYKLTIPIGVHYHRSINDPINLFGTILY